MARNAAGLGQFYDGIPAGKKHLHDPEAVGMGECPQAFRRLTQGLEANERRWLGLWRCG